MFIDPDVPLPDSTPPILRKDFEELQRYYDADDVSNYMLLQDGMEATIHNAYCMGTMSKADAVQLLHKMGIMV